MTHYFTLVVHIVHHPIVSTTNRFCFKDIARSIYSLVPSLSKILIFTTYLMKKRSSSETHSASRICHPTRLSQNL